MALKRIRLWRAILQVICFVIVLYGGLLLKESGETARRVDSGKPRTTKYGRDRLLWVSGADTVSEVYPPTLVCRFAAEGGIFKACSVHMLCENATWLTKFEELIPHVFLLILLSFLFARYWCGWVCPLGAITDFMNMVRKKTGIQDWRVPQWADTFLGGLRHFLLWAALGISILIALPVLGLKGVNDSLFLPYCQICPARIIYPALAGVQPCLYDFTDRITIFFTFLSWIALLFFLAGFFVPRLWCRVCAIGALLSYFNRGGAARLLKDASKCTYCGTCQRCCPMDIEMVYRERTRPEVTDTDCVLCLRCVEECPEPGCLTAKLSKWTVSES